MKKTVHFVHFSSRPGGIEVLLPVIVDSMPGYHFMGFVMNKAFPGDRNVYGLMRIPVVYGSGVNLKTSISLIRYARKHRNDIFHTYNVGPQIIILLWLSGVTNIVHSIHGTVHWKTENKRLITKLLWSLVLLKEFPMTSNSEYSRTVFRNKIKPEAKIEVVYNPVDGNKFTPSVNDKVHRELRIIFAGRLCNGKNLNKWLDQAFLIHNSMPEAVFEIYGSGPLQEVLQKKVNAHHAGTYIQLMGFSEDINNVYRQADILLFLSEYESFGNVVVESILCGTPVIVSDIPSMREIFRDFPEFIIQVDDRLEDNIINKLRDRDKLRKLAIRAREQFMVRFSVEAHVKALDRIYKTYDG